MDTAMSIRDASASAGVTEKTIRRWIKSGRIHAVKLGGQYRITVADLEQAKETPVQTPDTERPAGGHPSPRVDMSKGPDTGHADVQSPAVDLVPLVSRLQDETAWLRERLEEADRQRDNLVQQLAEERRRADVLQREALQRIEAVTAGYDAPGAPESTEPAPHGFGDSHGPRHVPASVWSRLWHRLRRA